MAPKKRSIKAEDLYDIEVLSSARISPDGRNVVFSLQRVDVKTEKKYSNLWISGTDGNSASAPRQFTYGDQNDGSPQWSPDGSQIAFLSNRGDKEKPAQLYLIPFYGGEARKLTDIEGRISEFSWSPDGKRILCSVKKVDADEIERRKDEQKKKLGTVARHYDRLFYKLDGVGYLPHERTHIWVVDVKTGKARQITDHPVWDENHPVWSPDGQNIAFVSNRSADPDQNPDAVDLFVIDAKGGEPRRIDTPIGEKSHPSYSPNGLWIAYIGSEGEGEWYKNTGVWIVPADGSAKPKNLLGNHDLHASATTINDIGAVEQMRPTWSPDSHRIYFQVSLHGCTILMSIDCSGENLQTVIGDKGVVSSYTISKDGSRMAYTFGKMDDLWQVYTRDMATGETTKLTSINQDLFAKIDLGSWEEHWFKGKAGNDLQGWLIKPPGFDPAKKYPTIIEIHGGPLTQYGFLFMHEFYYLAAKGYVVGFCNPRGGRGYGEEHARAIWGGWGSADYEDLMSWADYLAALPFVDKANMGVGGGSYGGYMTVWIIGHTDRFKAAVTMRAVSNLVSLWGSSDMNWVFQQILSNKAPFEDLEKYWKHSPIAYIGNARTPTLVIHSEFDLRCPIEQGEQVFVALKRLGVDTEMVRFPDEFHGLSRGGRTDRRVARLKHIERWFGKYLKAA